MLENFTRDEVYEILENFLKDKVYGIIEMFQKKKKKNQIFLPENTWKN